MTDAPKKTLHQLQLAMNERGLDVVEVTTDDPGYLRGRSNTPRWIKVMWRVQPHFYERDLADWLFPPTSDFNNEHRW